MTQKKGVGGGGLLWYGVKERRKPRAGREVGGNKEGTSGADRGRDPDCRKAVVDLVEVAVLLLIRRATVPAGDGVMWWRCHPRQESALSMTTGGSRDAPSRPSGEREDRSPLALTTKGGVVALWLMIHTRTREALPPSLPANERETKRASVGHPRWLFSLQTKKKKSCAHMEGPLDMQQTATNTESKPTQTGEVARGKAVHTEPALCASLPRLCLFPCLFFQQKSDTSSQLQQRDRTGRRAHRQERDAGG